MPSEKILATKQAQLAEVKARLDASVAGVIVDYKGISVADDTQLRKSMREAGVHYIVIKNTMLRHAIAGTDLEALSEHLEGTTALATSDSDVVAPAKLLNKFVKSQTGTFSIKAGYAEGKCLSSAGVEALAKLPDRNTLIATVLGTMNAPIAALARCIKQIAEKQEAPAEAAAPVEAAEAAPVEA